GHDRDVLALQVAEVLDGRIGGDHEFDGVGGGLVGVGDDAQGAGLPVFREHGGGVVHDREVHGAGFELGQRDAATLHRFDLHLEVLGFEVALHLGDRHGGAVGDGHDPDLDGL